MPLQQINLDQSIYSKAIQNRMMPQQIGGRKQKGTTFGGIMDTSDIGGSNSYVERQKAEWAAEDKEKKQRRDMQLQQAQEMGMRWGQQVQNEGAQQVQQQLATKQQVEQNPEPAAKEMYELMKTLPDEAKSQLLQQLFTPTSTGSTISGGGKTIQMPGKYNAIAKVFLDKGWAMFDPKGNVNLSEPKEAFEKGTYEIKEAGGNVYKLNSQTGESEVVFVPNAAYFPTSEDAMKGTPDYDGLDKKPVMIEKGKWKIEYNEKGTAGQTPEQEMEKWNRQQFGSFKRNILSGVNDLGFMIKPELRDAYLGMTYEEYMQFMQGETPARFAKDVDTGNGNVISGKGIFDKLLSKIGGFVSKNIGGKFDETNVTELLKIIPDNLSETQRINLREQGATDADITEAIKRKKAGKK